MFGMNTWVLVVLVAVALGLGGCGAYKLVKENQFIARGIVEQATIKVIDGDKQKREELLEAVNSLRDYVTASDKARLKEIKSKVVETEFWNNLSSTKKTIVREVFENVEDEIRSKMEDNLVDGEAKVALGKVYKWVIAGAEKAQVK